MANHSEVPALHKSGLRYAGDWAVEHWPYLAISVSGAAVTAIAAVSKILRPYGVLGWISAGLLTLLILTIVYAVYGWASERRANAIYKGTLSTVPVSVNPLDSNFEGKRIRLSELFSPFSEVYDGKTFRNCEIIGPGAIVFLDQMNLYTPGLYACDLVAVKSAHIRTAVGFQRSTFDHCKFYNATLFLPENVARQILSEAEVKGQKLEIIGLNG